MVIDLMAKQVLQGHPREPRRQTVLILDRVPRWEVETSPDPGDDASLNITVEDVQRQRNVTGSPQVLTSPSSAVFEALFHNSTTPVANLFFISANDNFAQLCQWRNFTSYRELERIDIGHQALLIEQIVVLACTVSDHRPFYNLYRHQCY
ncbi:hypothetical protein FRC06_002247, partial [Ceratobasidium sp. 370]